ncbi:sensor histidine kinase [Streptomyces sp. 7N604]|uniref:sensor histidine kinase n=1 Tax=Streptomyces sp. 7N604 TaxID=3457415 RepID=UPI003FD62A2B
MNHNALEEGHPPVQIRDRDAVAPPTAASTAPSHARRPWRWRRWRVGPRVLAVALIPLITACGLSGSRVLASTDRVQDYERERIAVDVAADLAELAHAVEAERDLTARHLASQRGTPALAKPRRDVDHQIRTIAARGAELRDAGGPALPLRTLAVDKLRTRLPTMRDAVDDERTPFPSLAVFRAYGELVDALLNGMEELTSASHDRGLAERRRTATTLAFAEAAASRERALVSVALERGSLDTAERSQLDRATADRRSSLASFRLTADATERLAYAETVTGGDVDESERIRVLLANQFAALIPDRASRTTKVSDPTAWYTAATRTGNLIRKVRTGFEDTLRTEVEQRRRSAMRAAYVESALLVLLLASTVTITLAVARSIIRPLRTLRSSALTVADRELPAVVQRLAEAERDPGVITVRQVPVGPPDEIGEVARAFAAVHVEAVRLATEQARLRASISAMFVNLARRIQSLVERQLNLIDRLENAELDPDQLENLFRLDHLATRMRRHGDGLLVLAGDAGTSPRRDPAPLLDVARAALAEVEGYERVDVVDMPEIRLVGSAVDDVVHLLAELIENALCYSSSRSRVRIACRFHRPGVPLIEVIDSGLGLSVSTLQEINAQLAEPASPDVRISQQMGVFVVARLAARHGMTVRLRPGVVHGTVAEVRIPEALLVSTTRPPSAGRPPSHWSTGSTSAARAQQHFIRAGEGRAAEPLTPADLPTRVPSEHLKPGSLQDSEQPSDEGPRSSPDAIRARLSGLQRGLQRGRKSRANGTGGTGSPPRMTTDDER